MYFAHPASARLVEERAVHVQGRDHIDEIENRTFVGQREADRRSEEAIELDLVELHGADLGVEAGDHAAATAGGGIDVTGARRGVLRDGVLRPHALPWFGVGLVGSGAHLLGLSGSGQGLRVIVASAGSRDQGESGQRADQDGASPPRRPAAPQLSLPTTDPPHRATNHPPPNLRTPAAGPPDLGLHP